MCWALGHVSAKSGLEVNMEGMGFNRGMLSEGKSAGKVREGFLEEGVWLTAGLLLLPRTAFLVAQIVYSEAVS